MSDWRDAYPFGSADSAAGAIPPPVEGVPVVPAVPETAKNGGGGVTGVTLSLTGDTVTGVTPTSRPKTAWTAAELVAAEFPEPRWAVPGLIPEGVTLLAGPPKVGKSWLVLGATMAVATGGIALSRVKVEAGAALYLALEDTPRRLKERLVRMLHGAAGPERLDVLFACPALPEGGDRWLRAWLDKHADARLVVVDVLARMRGSTPPGPSAYEADYMAVANFKAIADEYGVAVVLVHHVRKAAADDFLDTVSGTNGLAGAADAVLVLKRSRGQADGTLHLTGRDVEEAEHALKWTPDYGTWELLDGPALDYTLGDTRASIRRYLRGHGASRPKTIADGIEAVENTVRQTCLRMVDDGQLDTDGHGLYFLSGSEP